MRNSAVFWQFALARTVNMQVIGPLDLARSKKLNVGLNKPGRCSFTINGTLDIASEIATHSTCVITYRNGVPIWSGPVWTINDESDESTCMTTVSAIGWFELLNHRILKTGTAAPPSMPTTDATTQVYNNIDAGYIAIDLLNRTNAEYPTLIVPGTVEPSTNRNRTYQRFQNIGGEINTLTTLDSGFDWSIDPISRVFDTSFSLVKQDSTIFGIGVDRPEVTFGKGWGPENLSKAGRMTDGSKTMNQMVATGTYGSATVPDLSTGLTPSVVSYGLFQESKSMPEVPGNQSQATFLVAYAASEVAIRQDPQQIFSLVPKPYAKSPNVPQPFRDYGIGDIVYFVVRDGRLQVPPKGSQIALQPLRVFGLDIGIEDNGVERLDAIQGVMS